MELSWSVDREGEVSLVRCRLRNDDAVPRRVRLRSRLDGPVLPPRRGGVPEAGWDADGVTVRLDPDERLALGFATPASPVEPPMELDVDDAVETETEDPTPDAAAAVRGLGAHRPPRDAVSEPPDPDRGSGDGPEPRETEDDEGGGRPNERDSGIDHPVPSSQNAPQSTDPGRHDAAASSTSQSVDPVRVDDWLDTVERRVERGERLVDADVETATEVVAAVGGVDALDDLDSRLRGDAARLRRISDRASSLAARAERADVPTDALRRLS